MSTLTATRASVRTQSLWIAGFAALTAVAAHITIPHFPVPYTLQTAIVLMSGAVLGARRGALAQVAYLLAGAAGLPVFASVPDGTAALMSLFGPTGGYLLAFPVAAFAAGAVWERTHNPVWQSAALIGASLLIFALGTLQLQFVLVHDWATSFQQGFMIFSWWDVVKIVGAFSAARLIGARGR